MPNVSLMSCRSHALPKVVVHLLHVLLPEKQSGSIESGDEDMLSHDRDTPLFLTNCREKGIHDYVILCLITFGITPIGVCTAFSFSFAMVRRRSKSKDARTGPRPVDKKDARMRRWNTSVDIPMDEEDECAHSSLLKK